MSKRVALTIAAATALALEAHAADMPLKAPPLVAAAPVFNAKSLWAEGEYLYWQTKGDALPALVTGGGTGVLGAPGTSILFGNATVNEDWRSGARLRAGYWFDPNRQSGVEAHFFILGDASADFSASSTGATLIARPFFNTQLNAQDALLVASGGNPGAIGINDTSNILGTGIVYRKELCANCAIGPVSGLIGYRYLRLHDQLDISSFQNVVGIATTFGINDHFETRNEFHGLDLGVTGAIGNGPWNFEWLAKVALGATFTDITVRGATTISVGGVTTVSNGGLLALPTNIGNFNSDRFSVVPELNARFSYQFAPGWRALVGYNFIYWTGVVRPGGVIDTAVNPTQLPPGPLTGAARPAPRADTTDYWMHGVSVGARYEF